MNLSVLMSTLLSAAIASGMKMEDNCTMDRGLKCNSNSLLVPGSDYTVKSRCRNGKYPKNERCSWRFNFQGCRPVVSCDYIDTRKGKGKRCRGGDRLIMSSSIGWGAEAVLCGNIGKKTLTAVHASDIAAEQDFLDIKFSANRKKKGKRGRGFQCQVTCEEPAEPSTDCKCGVANRVNRIVGGDITEKNEYPWQVGLTNTNRDRPWCGGSILSDRTILTAAHCLVDQVAENLTVLVGEHDWSIRDGEQRMSVCNFVMHPKYKTSSFDYDIGILTLCNDINFTKEIAPVCPPSQPESDYANVTAIVTGWGRIVFGGSQSEKLMEVEVITNNNTECYDSYGGLFTDRMICAGDPGKGSCHGDSGGALVTDEGGYYSQIGVVSWGRGCAQDDPGVYARVTSMTRFIQDNIIGATCPPPSED